MSKVVSYQLQKEAETAKLEYLNVGKIDNVVSQLINPVYSLKALIKEKEPSLRNLNDSSIDLGQMQQGKLLLFDELSTVAEIDEYTRENRCPVYVRFRESLQGKSLFHHLVLSCLRFCTSCSYTVL